MKVFATTSSQTRVPPRRARMFCRRTVNPRTDAITRQAVRLLYQRAFRGVNRSGQVRQAPCAGWRIAPDVQAGDRSEVGLCMSEAKQVRQVRDKFGR